MSRDEQRVEYLETGNPPRPEDGEGLDLIRSVLAGPATWAEPPPRILEGLLTDLGATRTAPTPEATPPRWPRLVAAIGVAAAVVALLLSTVSVLQGRAETVVAVSGTELMPEASGVATLRPTGSGWWIRLDLSGVPPAPEDSYYQGWVWDEEGSGVAIGTFHLRGGAEPVILWAGVDLEVYRTISVTLEEEDDGPEPSGQTLLRGTLGDWTVTGRGTGGPGG